MPNRNATLGPLVT